MRRPATGQWRCCGCSSWPRPPPSKPAPRPSTNPKAVLVAADPALRETLCGLSTTMLIRHCAQLEITTPQDVTSAAVYTLQLLARRILALTEEIHDLQQRLTDTITRHTPTLLTHRAIGPDTAAALLITAG